MVLGRCLELEEPCGGVVPRERVYSSAFAGQGSGVARQKVTTRTSTSRVNCSLRFPFTHLVFPTYDDVSTRLRHAASQLPDFEKVTTWSVSFEAVGLFGGAIPLDNTSPFYLAFHRCRFVNLSATQKRILDLKIEIPTDDPKIPVLVLDTESMSFQEYRKMLTDKGIGVDESALGSKES